MNDSRSHNPKLIETPQRDDAKSQSVECSGGATNRTKYHSAVRTVIDKNTTMSFRQRNFLILAAATLSRSHGWLCNRPVLVHSSHFILPGSSVESVRVRSRSTRADTQSNTSRASRVRSIISLQSRRRNFSSDDESYKSKGILSRVGNAVKSVLPKNWFRSNEERQKIQRQKEVRDEISGGLNEILKDAPLGMRMMGRMVGPLVGRVASGLAETVAEQQRTTEALLEEARSLLMADRAVASLLGEPFEIGPPFSQSSSTSVINGKSQSRVELGLPIRGPRASGSVRLLASQDKISQLQVEANGRVLNVDLVLRTKSSRTGGLKKDDSDDNIIEAEIVEKKTK